MRKLKSCCSRAIVLIQASVYSTPSNIMSWISVEQPFAVERVPGGTLTRLVAHYSCPMKRRMFVMPWSAAWLRPRWYRAEAEVPIASSCGLPLTGTQCFFPMKQSRSTSVMALRPLPRVRRLLPKSHSGEGRSSLSWPLYTACSSLFPLPRLLSEQL